jgi:hypothetical protein
MFPVGVKVPDAGSKRTAESRIPLSFAPPVIRTWPEGRMVEACAVRSGLRMMLPGAEYAREPIDNVNARNSARRRVFITGRCLGFY